MKPALNGAETAVPEHKWGTQISHEQACEIYGLGIKELRGFIFNGISSIRYPIGDATEVDAGSLAAFLRRRAAARADGVTP
jgi:hypothetical protein